MIAVKPGNTLKGVSKVSELLTVNDVHVRYPVYGGILRRQIGSINAVNGVTFSIREGETLGLVGESGCGKSTIGRTVLGITRSTDGQIIFDGQTLGELGTREMRDMRRQMQMVFQDPYASLNPRQTVGETISEPIRVHGLRKTSAGIHERRDELLTLVGLKPEVASRYPHEFSGGQRQRIGIARALAVEPRFLVCDEAVSALDVSIQAQIINLLKDLREKLNLTYLFIAHGLAVVKHISDRVAVMYMGKIVEIANTEELYSNSLHPYTRALLSAAPIPDPDKERQRERIILKGDLPSPASLPSGCHFHTRCPMAIEQCKHDDPPLETHGVGHLVACWRSKEVQALLPSTELAKAPSTADLSVVM